MKQTKVFEAEDGTTFATAAECKRYEEIESLVDLLSGLTVENVGAAFDRADPIADAFERAGAIIAKKRRASGKLKRGSLMKDAKK